VRLHEKLTLPPFSGGRVIPELQKQLPGVFLTASPGKLLKRLYQVLDKKRLFFQDNHEHLKGNL